MSTDAVQKAIETALEANPGADASEAAAFAIATLHTQTKDLDELKRLATKMATEAKTEAVAMREHVNVDTEMTDCSTDNKLDEVKTDIEEAVAPTEVPIELPVEAPIEEPVEVPIDVPIELPIEASIEVPLEAPMVDSTVAIHASAVDTTADLHERMDRLVDLVGTLTVRLDSKLDALSSFLARTNNAPADHTRIEALFLREQLGINAPMTSTEKETVDAAAGCDIATAVSAAKGCRSSVVIVDA